MKHLSDFNGYSTINERYKISNLPKHIILLSDALSNEHGTFLLYDTKKEEPIGYISFNLYKKINSFTVGGAYAQDGYGAFLYECAMTYIYPNGLSMSRDGITSDDALNVWWKFSERNDVKKERMYSDEKTHKQEDWIAGGFLDDDPEYRQSIFDLEDTRFFYSFGKDKLTKLIKIGKDYMVKNGISEQGIEYMIYELE